MIFLKWLVLSFALLFVAWVLPGIALTSITSAFAAVFVIGIVNLLIRPVLFFLTAPINILTLGFFTLIINALLFLFVASIVPGFSVEGFWQALLGALLYSIFSAFINKNEIF